MAAGNYYGIHLEKDILALDWSRLRCQSCGHEFAGTPEGKPKFARTLAEIASECLGCSKKAMVPKVYAPDLVASRERRIVVEIYGEKSSAKNASKMEFYRTNGFLVVTVPNEVADNAEYSKPIFQLLALVCGSDHPERLYTPELA